MSTLAAPAFADPVATPTPPASADTEAPDGAVKSRGGKPAVRYRSDEAYTGTPIRIRIRHTAEEWSLRGVQIPRRYLQAAE